MQKKIITLAVAAALTAPLAAQADATMYGRLNLSLEAYDADMTDITAAGAWAGTDSTSNVRMVSDSSKIGVKGSEDLGNGLKAIYQMEWTVNMMDENGQVGRNEFNANGSALSARNMFAGLTGDWGTFIMGRHDTPLKISTGKLDYFADSAADYDGAHMMAGFQDRRADQALAYISPNWNGLTLAAALVPGENGLDRTGPAGWNNPTRSGADSIADAYSLAAMYENSGFYGSLAYEAGDEDLDTLFGNTGTLNSAGVGDLAQWRLGLGYDGGFWKVAGVYEDMEIDTEAGRGGSVIDVQRWMINGAYSFGNATVKASYFQTEGDCNDVTGALCGHGNPFLLAGASAPGVFAGTDANQDGDGWAIGLDYALSKRTDVSVLYANSQYDDTYANAGVGVGVTSSEQEVFGVGLSHKF